MVWEKALVERNGKSAIFYTRLQSYRISVVHSYAELLVREVLYLVSGC